jgi:ABC-type multidrug transport system fused ATPase/permease subunit
MINPEESRAVLAYTYPLLSIFWTMLEFFLFFLWIWLIITVFADIFRSHDLGGVAKALWVISLILVPFLGVFIYVIARGGSMHERAAAQAQLQRKAFDSYLQHAANAGSMADQLGQLSDLKDKGTITEAEFAAEKAKILH